MPLSRYINAETILSINEPQYGQLWNDRDLALLNDELLIPSDPNIVKNQRSEIHILSFYGEHIASNHDAAYTVFDKQTNSLLIDIRETFAGAGIDRGSFLIVVNMFGDVWGEFSDCPVVLREISPDRTELKFSVDADRLTEFEQFKNFVIDLGNRDILNGLSVNFGYNRIQRIVNAWFDGDGSTFYVKLYGAIDEEIDVKDVAWFGYETVDPYIDTVILSKPIVSAQIFDVGAPNFYLDTKQYQSNSTTYKSWEDVLDANLATRQRIIESSLSGSVNIALNIDFTDFSNYVFYSSAEERLRNFHYKVSKIEEYSSSISTLLNSTASNTPYISGSVDLNRRRIDQLTSTFDPWEKWLYYEPTASLFTHDVTGSVTPWPKRIISGSWQPYPISSSIVENWYNTLIVSASEYDVYNNNRLYWSIPEHIYMNPANSDFVTFIDMVGEHFDVLYAYITAMTKIHERDEHPQRGAPNGVLYHIAKSFGWNLQNTRQLADLWTYKTGTDASGSFADTGSMRSRSGEDQTSQIWKRIVNSLPYLLKTKGTSRSVKSLLSIYGIPQTLISIKEYGGPSKKSERPYWVDDRFKYEAVFTGSNYIELNRRILPPSSGSWGGVTRVPDTIEFTFRTTDTSSVSMSLWAIEDGTNRSRVLYNLYLVHAKYTTGTSSYSGSHAYGRLQTEAVRWNSSTNTVFGASGTTDTYLPYFDGDAWTIKIKTNVTLTQSLAGSQFIQVTASKQSDCSSYIISSSIANQSSGAFSFVYGWGAGSGSATTPHIALIGGTTGSVHTSAPTSRFKGTISGYKEYFTNIPESAYYSHVRNPSAYHDGTASGSYYTLYRYFPLGVDQQRWDHSVYTQVSSSQPNRSYYFDTTASFVGWTGSESDQYRSYNETHYIDTPSLGGNLLYSSKVRKEDIALARDLSPSARSEAGRYDYDGIDSNRLAIVFAPNDHTNFDIFNHSGFFELDDYVGDPMWEYEEEYGELNRFKGQYLKKYAARYDTNALIKILSLYDYTFFEQVKQLIPAKADAILGVLIEPDVLHRSKVRLTRRPEITNPQYDADVPRYEPSQSGELPMYDATASSTPVVTMGYTYVTASASRKTFVTASHNYITGSLLWDTVPVGDVCSHNESGSNIGSDVELVPNKFSGSQSPTMSYVDNYRLNCCYKKVIYHYSASGTFATDYERKWRTAVSMSYKMYYSRSLECTSYQYIENECSVENRWRFGGSKLEGADFNIPSSTTVDGGPVVTIWESNPNTLKASDSPFGGNLTVD